MPAIDGLRCVSVLAVLLFHAGLPYTSGGYLGVSVFFTISGFVITRSLLDRGAPVRLGGFYARRVRRLLPASLLTVCAVVVAVRFGWLPRITAGEVRWTLANLANWFHLREGDGYAELFTGQRSTGDPLVHFWSLAIEEQFYVVWPLVMAVLLRLQRRWVAAAVLGLAVATSIATVVAGRFVDSGTVYYHTLLRAPEVLIGCAAAFVPARARVPGAVPVFGLAAIVAAVVLTGSGSTAWPYAGLLPIFAIVSAVVVVGLTRPGPATRLLARPPVVYLGRISYGVYLFHWPLFVGLTKHGASRWLVAGLGIPITIGLAALSYHAFERRITLARWPHRATLAGGALALATVFVATTSSVGPAPTTLAMPTIDPDKLAAVAFDPAPTEAPLPTSTVPTSSGPPLSTAPPDLPPTAPPTSPPTSSASAPRRILVVGDSTAQALGAGMVEWAYDTGAGQVTVAAAGGCGLLRGGDFDVTQFNVALHMVCSELVDRTIPDTLPDADVVVVLNTLADVWTRSWDDRQTWLTAADPEFQARLVADYRHFVDTAVAAGVPSVVFLRPPVAGYDDGSGTIVDPSFGNGQQDWIWSVVTDLADTYPGVVATADLRAWFEATGLADDPTARPDGTHFTSAVAERIVAEFLAPALEPLPRRG